MKKLINSQNLLEPLMFIGAEENGFGFEYNLDALTKIEVTESFMGLDKSARECAMEPFYNCTTRQYLNVLLDKCGCLPLSIRLSNEVSIIIITVI